MCNLILWVPIFANSILLMLHLMYPETSLLLQLCFIYLIYLFRVGLATTKTRDVVILH